ncbi:MAG: hypothetical protein OQK24_09200 [Magnetovibrio sp.]|nr:hypothetical protein [Magnetovibrio sp.]
MAKKLKSILCLSTITIAVTSCQTTQTTVSKEAQAFKYLASKHCVVSLEGQVSSRKKINTELTHVYSISPRRDGWLAADVSSPGGNGRVVRDNIYFNPKTKEFACGTKAWRRGNYSVTSNVNINNKRETTLILSDIKMLKGQKVQNVSVEHNGIFDSGYFFNQGEVHLKIKMDGYFKLDNEFINNFYQNRVAASGGDITNISKLTKTSVPAGVFGFMTYQDKGRNCFEFITAAYGVRKTVKIIEGKLCEQDNEYIRADGLSFLSDLHHMNAIYYKHHRVK